MPDEKSIAVYDDEDAKFLGLPSPGAMNLLKKFCAEVAGTPLCPASLSRGNAAANMLAVVLTGKEMGLSPMQSLRSFWLSPDGRLAMYGDAMMAVLRTHGVSFVWHKNDNAGCKVTGKRKDGEEFTSEFTVEDAKTAGIWQRDKSLWPKYPKTMARHRCEGEMFRALGSDFGGSNIYEQSEVMDMEEYETVAPSSNGSPEVQVPREEPAKAGRKPKDRPINVTAETVTVGQYQSEAETKPKPTEPPPVPPTEPAATYYVIPSDAKMPALDKLEPGPIEKLNIAALKTADLPEAMKTSDQATKATGTSHYVLQFQDGKARILHTSKLPEAKPKPAPRMYIVAPEPQVKASATVAEITALAVQAPHADLSTCEVVAQAKANATGVVHLVLYLLGDGPEKGTYQLQSKAMPPTASAPGPAQKPVEAGSEEEIRTRVKGKYEWLKNQVPQSVPTAKQRAAIVHQYLMAYLGIAQIADFSKDLVLAEQALLACEADLARDPVELVAHPVELGKAARGLAGSYVAPAETPKMSNGEIAAMAKYYQERGWSGQTTSMAEVYRRAEKPEPSEFQKMLKFAGIEVLGDRDAAAYFAVSTHYEKETAKKFAMAVDATKYGETLTAIRDEYDGKELKEIPAHQFVKGLENVLSPEPDEPNLFGGQ